MKVFLDTNIIIDFYDKRGEFYYPAAIIFDLAYKGKIQICVGNHFCQCILLTQKILSFF